LDKCWNDTLDDSVVAVVPRGISSNLEYTSGVQKQTVDVISTQYNNVSEEKKAILEEKIDGFDKDPNIIIGDFDNGNFVEIPTESVETEIPKTNVVSETVSPPEISLPVINKDVVDVPVAPSRPVRNRRSPVRYGYDGSQGYGYTLEAVASIKEKAKGVVQHCSNLSSTVPPYMHPAVYYLSCQANFTDGSIDCTDPSVYAAVYNKNIGADTYKYHQALLLPDWEKFQAAAVEEIQTLESMGTWMEVDRSSVPQQKRILGGTWVFKRKRTPEGVITKYKARFCVRGDQQEAGVDYFDTYAPVTMWSTVRTMFVLSIICNLHTVQVDYTNAFAQAKLKEDVYIELPKGFTSKNPDKDVVLKLQKSLYGLVQAPKTFYDHLAGNLKKHGFQCCENVDSCLWVNKEKGVICVIWVDDCLFFSKSISNIDNILKSMNTTMPLTKEQSVTAFLGIQILRSSTSYTLTQPKLIQQIIDACDMTECNGAKTPAHTTPLGADIQGKDFKEKWEYSSVVGMLMFLANNTRPDIAFATHQCARFTHSPKESHGLAVKRIVRYLQATKDKGLIMTPTKDISLDCYVDADFAGLYGVEDNDDPVSVKSRTGYVLLLADCPLIWVSKLQTEIAVSTMEAEYIALSQSMKELIPLRRITTLVCDALLGKQNYKAKMYSKVFEDNVGALQLARSPRMTPRTKHYGIKYHFFRENVVKGEIQLFKVESEYQRADIFTKGLVQAIFERLRKLLQGW
jgi:Reverse transcriptase (RNA-dependent DNA polymerase)